MRIFESVPSDVGRPGWALVARGSRRGLALSTMLAIAVAVAPGARAYGQGPGGQSVPPTMKSVRVPFSTVAKVENGKFTEVQTTWSGGTIPLTSLSALDAAAAVGSNGT
jgi:hypothetical protein